ncbi:MAG: hypothetical protein IKJ19_06630 [Clostridia bacterium]|nr:hypothetical protein [Clostridia bacterium]
MKTVIRKNVFETNSSSTHSLSILGRAKNKCASKGYSFELRSPLAKAVQMIGLIDNAEKHYLSEGYWIDEDEQTILIKQKIASRVKEFFPESFADKKVEDITAVELCNLLNEIDEDKIFGEYGENQDEFFGEDDYLISNFFTIDRYEVQAILKFREYIIEEYAKKVGKSKQEGLYDLEFEAFANVEIKKILDDGVNVEQKLTDNMKFNYKFKREFDESKEKDIVKFAKEFLIKDFEEFKEYRKGKFSCELYFCNGCLDSCYCGFESAFDIVMKLDLQTDNDLQLKEKAKWLLSNACRIVAKEYYSGLILEETGEIY